MTEVIINKNSKDQRVDRFIKKFLPEIPPELIQKSIRKKNITVNGKKVKPNYFLKDQDSIQIFFSDETINKFKGAKKELNLPSSLTQLIEKPAYEDQNFIVINKPVGLLTQPDYSNDFSISDIITQTIKKDSTFSPAPLNRLDKNTSGIILIPKNYEFQKTAAKAIKNHSTKKEYLTLINGTITEPGILKDNYSKDHQNNMALLEGNQKVELEYFPIENKNNLTLLMVNLITGKSHQIRAQLSNAGFPIIGDPKYGDKDINNQFRKKYNLRNQLLHAYRYIIYNNGKKLIDVMADLPDQFKSVLNGESFYGFLEKTTRT